MLQIWLIICTRRPLITTKMAYQIDRSDAAQSQISLRTGNNLSLYILVI